MALICQDLAVIIAKAEAWAVREDMERILNWAAAKDLLLVHQEQILGRRPIEYSLHILPDRPCLRLGYNYCKVLAYQRHSRDRSWSGALYSQILQNHLCPSDWADTGRQTAGY